MTLCVASLFKDEEGAWGVVAASDRKLSVGDIGYEAAVGKYFTFNRRVLSLISGDVAAALQILNDAQRSFDDAESASVEEAAEAVASQFRRHRARRAEGAFLEPLGLTSESFLSRQAEFSPLFLHQLQNELLAANLGVEVIVAGVGASGAQIFHVSDPGVARNQSGVGFAVIGEGWHHALSYFSENQFTSGVSLANALYTTYAAKRVGEIANTVGFMTDLLAVFPHGDWFLIADHIQDELRTSFEQARTGQQAAVVVALGETTELVTRIRSAPRKAQLPPEGMESAHDTGEGQGGID